MELARQAYRDPAWETIDDRRSAHAQRALETVCERFGGVLVGPGPLVRSLVDEGRMGHRSVLEALNVLVAHGLLYHRRSRDQTVFWVPNRLVQQPTPGRSRRHHPGPRRNGSSPVEIGSSG